MVLLEFTYGCCMSGSRTERSLGIKLKPRATTLEVLSREVRPLISFTLPRICNTTVSADILPPLALFPIMACHDRQPALIYTSVPLHAHIRELCLLEFATQNSTRLAHKTVSPSCRKHAAIQSRVVDMETCCQKNTISSSVERLY
jgi:hypothetical protein